MGQRHLLFVAVLAVSLALGAGAGTVQAQETPEPDTDRAAGAQPQVNDSTRDTQGDQFEPNDGLESATRIEPGSYGNLSIGEGDVDFYALELAAGETVTVQFSFEHAAGDVDAALLSENGIGAVSVSSTDDENITYVAPADGTYYLAVYGFGNATNDYGMDLAVAGGTVEEGEREPNDDFDTATPAGDGTIENLTVEEGDVDVYAVNATAGQPLSASIAFEHDEGDLDMALLDRDRLQAIAVSDGVTDNESVSYVPAESGTVYVVVAGFLDAANTYTLTVDGAAGGGDGGSDGIADTPGPENATGDGGPPGPEDAAIRAVVGLEDESAELGAEDGIAAGESLDVSRADGLSAAEFDVAVSRAAARAEELRGLEFRGPVSVAVVSRENLSAGGTDATPTRLVQGPYLNQMYEATFIVDEETDAVRELQTRGGTAVGGFYVPSANTLVVVSDSPQRPQVDESILVHELVHALQDQHLELERVGATDALADESAATLGLIEGDAEYVREQFLRECESEWGCLQPDAALEPPDQGTPDQGNLGIAGVTLQPYSDGPALVAQLRESDNWSAVNDAYEDPPASTEQVIHPDRYPEEEPGALTVENTPREGWALFGTDRLGEAWIYTMFWYQGVGYDNPIVDQGSFTRPDQGEFDTYNYTSAPSEGWDNDQLRMYTRDGEFGYVWTIEWDSEADATDFREAYRRVLEGQGAEQRDNNTWVIPDGQPYADAFAVRQDGQRVTIVNGPESEDLPDIAPDVLGED